MVGIQNFASNLSGIVAPMITGWLKHETGNYGAASWAILAVLLLGLAAYGLLVRVDAPTQAAGQTGTEDAVSANSSVR